MGNALEAAKFSVLQGNTGVANKKTTLAAIDTGMADVKAWKDSIDAERLKLKTDTADRFREAEKDANDKIEGLDPSNKTERDIIINGLADYKDRLYGNMNMVKAGMIKPEDNIIFQANGKQSFEIMSTNVKNIAAENKLTLERAKGGYWPDEEGGADVFHDPKSMGFEAALQRIQSTLTNPEFTKVKFGEDGMGTVEFYETQVNEATKIRELKRDKDGKPIPLPGKSGISLLAFQQGRNQRADYFNLKTQTEKLTDSDSALGRSFEVFMQDPQNKMYGNIETYQANNPQVKELIEDAIGVATNTVERSMSILSDNGPRAERSEIMTPAEWASATKQGIDLNEKISYSYVDANGKTQTGSKFKYVEIVVGANNQIVPKWRDGDLDAAEKSAGSSIYAALSRKLKGGTKRSEFQSRPPTPAGNKVKDDKATVLLIDQAVTGNVSSLEALMRSKTGGVIDYNITETDGIKSIVFTKTDGTVTNPIPMNTPGVDAGKLFAAEMGLNAETYIQETTLKDEAASSTVSKFKGSKLSYNGLGNLDTGFSSKDGVKTPVTAAQELSELIKFNPDELDMVGTAQKVVDKARSEYGIEDDIVVQATDEGGPNDSYTIVVNGVSFKSPSQGSAKNHKWLLENIDRTLRGEKPQGESTKVGKYD
mgnify:FL=1